MDKYHILRDLRTKISHPFPCKPCRIMVHSNILVSSVTSTHTMMNWKGQYEAATYEFIETPEETGLGDIECRLNLLEIADGTFKDGGHALAWALKAAE